MREVGEVYEHEGRLFLPTEAVIEFPITVWDAIRVLWGAIRRKKIAVVAGSTCITIYRRNP